MLESFVDRQNADRHEWAASRTHVTENGFAAPVQEDWVASGASRPQTCPVKASHALWRQAMEQALHGATHDVRTLVRLKEWPDMAMVPPELVQPVTRMCALLWRKPTAGVLLPLVLDYDARAVSVLLKTLRQLGCVQVSHAGREEEGPSSGFEETSSLQGNKAFENDQYLKREHKSGNSGARLLTRLLGRIMES